MPDIRKKGEQWIAPYQNAVNFKVAEEYLGITRRGLQKAIKADKLALLAEAGTERSPSSL